MRNIFSILFSLLLLSACTANHSKQSESDRLTADFDHGNYAAAMSQLENQAANNSDDQKLNLRLVQAYLGKANFVLQNMAEQTLSDQQNNAVNDDAQKIFQCSMGGIENKDQLSMFCALVRISATVPNPDNPDLQRARQLLSERLPEERSNASINFFAAVVEISSMAARIRILANAVLSESNDVDLIIREIKRALLNLVNGVQRVVRSYEKINQKLDGIESSLDERWGFKVQDHRSVEDVLIFAFNIFKSRAISEEETWRESNLGKLNAINPKSLAEKIDHKYFHGKLGARVNLINELESILLRQDKSEHHSLIELCLHNPPQMLRNLHDAIINVWDSETAGPLLRAIEDGEIQFHDLKRLISDWKQFYAALTPEQQKALRLSYEREAEKIGLMKIYTAEQREMAEFSNKAQMILKKLDLPYDTLNPIQERLIDRTNAWIAANLW